MALSLKDGSKLGSRKALPVIAAAAAVEQSTAALAAPFENMTHGKGIYSLKDGSFLSSRQVNPVQQAVAAQVHSKNALFIFKADNPQLVASFDKMTHEQLVNHCLQNAMQQQARLQKAERYTHGVKDWFKSPEMKGPVLLLTARLAMLKKHEENTPALTKGETKTNQTPKPAFSM